MARELLGEELLMGLCLEYAWQYQSLTLPNPAVAAMVVDKNGKILSMAAHQIAGGAHAEVLALQEAYVDLSGDRAILELKDSKDIHKFLENNHNNIFQDCSIYVTLEPCNNYGKTPPCARLLALLKPRVVYISAPETKNIGGIEILRDAGIEVKSGILKERGEDLLLPFLCLQKKDRFVLFKLAMRLDGDYKSGSISSHLARQFTHNQRSRAKSILISKNTLLNDNPKLDCRFASKPYSTSYSPDVGIVTRDESFKPDLGLNIFLQKDRKVRLINSPLELESGFHIIEGGWGLLEAYREWVDMIIVHISPSLVDCAYSGASFMGRFRIVHLQKMGDDVLLWLVNS